MPRIAALIANTSSHAAIADRARRLQVDETALVSTQNGLGLTSTQTHACMHARMHARTMPSQSSFESSICSSQAASVAGGEGLTRLQECHAALCEAREAVKLLAGLD